MIFSDCEGGSLEGGKGADYFDCGEGIDIVVVLCVTAPVQPMNFKR